MEKGQKVNQLLGMADFHYLSARILFLHILYPTAWHTSATAVEMYFKMVLFLKGNQDTRRYGHNLAKIVKETGIKLDPEAKKIMSDLEKSYKGKKYPDSWESDVIWKDDLDRLDILVRQLRNLILEQIPIEEKKSIQDILKILTKRNSLMPEVATRYGTANLNSFSLANQSFHKFKFCE